MSKPIELGVRGMTCASCVGRVERSLNKVEGVENAGVNLATKRATVTYDPARTTPAALLNKVRDIGYEDVQIEAGQDRADTGRQARDAAQHQAQPHFGLSATTSS